ncbi:MAG: glutamate--tRNA ligase [Ignisphaera sp.]
MSLLDAIKDQIRQVALKHALVNRFKYGQAKPEPIVNKILGEFKEVRQYTKDVIAIVRDIVHYVNNLDNNEFRKLIDELNISLESEHKVETKTLPPLPNVDKWKNIKTRFAPNPDFPIHLGNARAAILSYTYATMYKGTFILRFEDTDPRTKKPMLEAYEIIREDLRWLGVSWDEEYIQSLRMDIYYEYLKKLIERGYAYIDTCNPEIFKELRNKGVPCPHRDTDPSTNMEKLDKIFAREYGEGEAVVRIKTDLTHPDPAVRDWVIFRIIDTSRYPHPITGDKYILWPTYNFAAAIDDHLMNISHILRGREHTLNTIKQMYIYNYFNWRYPEVVNLGRVGLEELILSKTWIKTQLKLNPDKFMGFDDVRFGTIAALRRRGVIAETIRQIILDLGIKGSDAKISWKNIAALNRRLLDPKTKRVFVVCDPVKVHINNLSTPLLIKIPYHPSSNLGQREYSIKSPIVYISSKDAETFMKNGYLRLMEFANIKFLRKENDTIIAEYIDGGIEEAKRLEANIVQWVPADHRINVRIISVKGMNLGITRCLGESSLLKFNLSDIVQMVRIGFGRIDTIKKKSITIILTHE